jgi:phenylpropionate dioxygenase-like ring-hydroxylating dioxygenase large terminal subunit
MLRSRVPTNFPWALGTKESKTSRLFDGRRLAMFKDSKGRVRAVEDVCPHRGARLSNGTVKSGCIECPYHGWRFDGDGTLVSVPTTYNLPEKGDVKSYNIEELYDFVWNVPPESPVSPPMLYLLNDPKWQRVSGSEEVKGNWIDWIANSTDISHINYVHDFGNENNGTIDEMIIDDQPGKTVCTAYVRPKASSVLTQPIQVKKSPIKVEFVYPNTTIIHIKLKKPYEFVTYTTITPITKDASRITWCFAYKMNLSFFHNHFSNQMKKTISEDEAIISEIPRDFPFKVNVPCDKFQTTVLDNLHKYVLDNEENLFTLL